MKILSTIPKEKQSITDGLKLPLSIKNSIEFNKNNLFVSGEFKEINRFIIQSLLYLPLSYNIKEFDIVLIDFNDGNKTLFPLTAIDTIKYVFLEPEAINLSISLDEMDQNRKTIFFIFERENMSTVMDYEEILKDTFSNFSKNKNFYFITCSYEDKKIKTNANFLKLKNIDLVLEKNDILSLFLKINLSVNDDVVSPMNYRRSRIAYIKNKRLI